MDRLRVFFEELAGHWDAQQPPDRGEVLHQMLTPFDAWLQPAQAVLEVGTGTGALIPLLHQRAPHARIVSMDLAHSMLCRARQRCPDALLLQADVHRLPFTFLAGTAFFDLIVCHNSFPHFARKEAALLEMTGVLRPGGRLLILHDLGREQVNAIHSGAGEPIQNDLLPRGEEACRMLARAGFCDAWVEDTPVHYRAVGRWPGL
jgi:ubiquinone/menaquinone biosynthesis C-methylase UbiE